MRDDLLEQATRALREETEGDDAGARFTRARIVGSLHGRERRRRSRLALLLPIAAVLVGSSAFAAGGGRLSWGGVAAAIGIGDAAPAAPAPAAPAPLRRTTWRALPTLSTPEPEAAEPEPVAEAETKPEPEPETPAAVAAVPRGQGARPAPARTTTLESAAPDPGLELYRSAHRAHFGGGSAAGALAAWDRYLAASPRGRFVLEASYNRAICLVRLGRSAEARAALEPFASGAYGKYRQDSARELMAALGGASQ